MDIETYYTIYSFNNAKYTYEEFLKKSLKILYKKSKLKCFDGWIILSEIIGVKNERDFYFDMPYLITISSEIFSDSRIARINVGFIKKIAIARGK